jgi:hypothetical protein
MRAVALFAWLNEVLQYIPYHHPVITVTIVLPYCYKKNRSFTGIVVGRWETKLLGD